MKLEFFTASLLSAAHPKENQDAYFLNKKEATAGVFDGVGGLAHSGQAAKWAAACFRKELRLEGVEKAFQNCHMLLKERGIKNFGREIATTVAIAKIYLVKTEDENLVVWANAGDSRVYHFSNLGLLQISTDDSLITQAFEKGWINQATVEKIRQAESLKGFNEIEKNLFQSRNIIIQALGIGVMSPRMGKFKARAGDLIILTSDGVHDNLTNLEIEGILKQDLRDPAASLVNSAQKVSEGSFLRAKPDDITAVVIKCC